MHTLSGAARHQATARLAPTWLAVMLALFIIVVVAITSVSVARNSAADDPAAPHAPTERPSYDRLRFIEENTWLPGGTYPVGPQAGDQRRADQSKPTIGRAPEWRHFARIGAVAPGLLALAREPWLPNPNRSRGGLIRT